MVLGNIINLYHQTDYNDTRRAINPPDNPTNPIGIAENKANPREFADIQI
jgi:hypothetical protein